MTYLYCDTLTQASASLQAAKDAGRQGYILMLNANEYEVRTWA